MKVHIDDMRPGRDRGICGRGNSQADHVSQEYVHIATCTLCIQMWDRFMEREDREADQRYLQERSRFQDGDERAAIEGIQR